MRLLVKVRTEQAPCSRCGRTIEPGWLYVVGPPPHHVACPSPKWWRR